MYAKGQAEVTPQDIRTIARRHNVSNKFVYDVVEQRRKTDSKTIAESVSACTGKPFELYLVQKGVKIDPVPQEKAHEDWSWERVDEQTALKDIPDLDLLQLQREAMLLAAEIAVEMQRRVG